MKKDLPGDKEVCLSLAKETLILSREAYSASRLCLEEQPQETTSKHLSQNLLLSPCIPEILVLAPWFNKGTPFNPFQW